MEVMNNILITGATGFIGKHLLRTFVTQNNNHVTILVRENVNLDMIHDLQDSITIHYYTGDYHSIDTVFKHNCFDYVVHLAAMSCYDCPPEDVSNMIDANITLGTFLLAAMKQHGCRYFINTSTYWQHYKDQHYQPVCLYAATKKAFEDIIDYYCLDQRMTAISLKLYDVYGYDEHRNKLLNHLLTAPPEQPIALTPGEQKLYMVFIDDVIRAYQTSMHLIVSQNKGHTVYGVYGEQKYSLKDMVKIVEEVTNKNLAIKFGAKDYNQFQIMDAFAENRLPGWHAKVSLEQGLHIILNHL